MRIRRLSSSGATTRFRPVASGAVSGSSDSGTGPFACRLRGGAPGAAGWRTSGPVGLAREDPGLIVHQPGLAEQVGREQLEVEADPAGPFGGSGRSRSTMMRKLSPSSAVTLTR